MNELGFVNSP